MRQILREDKISCDKRKLVIAILNTAVYLIWVRGGGWEHREAQALGEFSYRIVLRFSDTNLQAENPFILQWDLRAFKISCQVHLGSVYVVTLSRCLCNYEAYDASYRAVACGLWWGEQEP